MNRHLMNAFWVLLLSVLLAICSCDQGGDRVSIGQMRNESKTIEIGAAKSVQVNLNMKAGELKVGGGATGLLEANFNYNVPEWKP